jgi:decaprenylphospho-beta-D-erythro-pentofuranosid-2-ulose 2-reductase
MTTPETWLILGASSAIARAFAREAAARGAHIILAGRDTEDLHRTAADITITSNTQVSVLEFDALDFPSHAALPALLESTPGILNIALLFGTMPDQAAMDADPSLARDCIASTFTGAVSVLHHLAPLLESRRAGTIIGIGSVAGDRGRLKNYVYGAAKSGLHTYLAGLRNRLGRSGVHVMTVKPGFIDTAMTFGLPGLFLVASPDYVARTCLNAAAKRRDVIYVPWFWWGIMTIIRHVPERIFKRMAI